MKPLKLAIFILFLFSCRANNKIDSSKDEIVVVGQAFNLKGTAAVLSSVDNTSYNVGELSAWDQEDVGKTVKVWGKLWVNEIPPPEPGEPEKQQVVGTIRVIQKAKWEFVK